MRRWLPSLLGWVVLFGFSACAVVYTPSPTPKGIAATVVFRFEALTAQGEILPKEIIDVTVVGVAGNQATQCAEGPDRFGVVGPFQTCPWNGKRLSGYRHTVRYSLGAHGVLSGTALWYGQLGQQVTCWPERNGMPMPSPTIQGTPVTTVDPETGLGLSVVTCSLVL